MALPRQAGGVARALLYAVVVPGASDMTHATTPRLFWAGADPYVIVLGTNEIASAIAVRLCWNGFRVVMSHDPFPPVLRRRMAFHDALFDDRAEVDGITGRRADTALEIAETLTQPGCVAVTHLPLTDLIPLRLSEIIVDSRMQKHRVIPDLRGVARLAIGIGPRFIIGENCDIAVETHPKQAGELVEIGETARADGMARLLGGVGKERFVYSPRPGVWRTPLDVGAKIFKGLVLGYLDDGPITAPRDGFLRGIIRDGTQAPANVKLIEVDPRGRAANWTGIDERGRTIAAAVMAAIERVRASRKPFSRLGATVH